MSDGIAAAVDRATWFEGRVALHEESRQSGDEELEPTSQSEAESFAQWVDWLRQTYALEHVIPEEWPSRPPVVAELVGLYRGHLDATSPEAIGADLSRWHDSLEATLRRVSEHEARLGTREMSQKADRARLSGQR